MKTFMTKILVVEDELAIRELLVSFLKLCGWETNSAGNAFEALGILKDDRHDVVITDGIMPQVSGPKFTKIIKKKYPETYVIALTGSNLREEFNAAGANVYLEKPVGLKRLQIAIEQYFKGNSGGKNDYRCMGTSK